MLLENKIKAGEKIHLGNMDFLCLEKGEESISFNSPEYYPDSPKISFEYNILSKELSIISIYKNSYGKGFTNDMIEILCRALPINIISILDVKESNTLDYFFHKRQPFDFYLSDQIFEETTSPFLKAFYRNDFKNISFEGFAPSGLITKLSGKR